MSKPAETFSFAKPELGEKSKRVRLLARTDIAICATQVVREGGENNLHSHTHLDGFWLVLEGRARFYTTDDELVADLGPHEGVLIPRGFQYWFESSGDVDLQLLQFEASARRLGDDIAADRVDHQPRRAQGVAELVER